MVAPHPIPTPKDEPVELQAFAFRTLREAVAPFSSPELDRALREWWLTKVLPGPVRYAAYDDGDWAAVWAELLDLRGLLNALAERKTPSDKGGLRPVTPAAAAGSVSFPQAGLTRRPIPGSQM